MLRNLNIGTRLAVGFGGLVAITVVIMAMFYLVNSNRLIAQAEKRELQGLYNAIQAQADIQAFFSEAMSAIVANQPQVQTAFANGDRQGLINQFRPVFARLKQDYGVAQFQFHTAPATSFLRLHKIEKYGDDLTRLRATIVETNRTQAPVRGLDGGVAGIGIRGLSPIRYQGQHIGSVEFGLNLAQGFAERFSQEFGAGVAIHVLQGSKVNTLASTISGNSLISQQSIQTAWRGEEVLGRQQSDSRPYATLAHSISDFSGQPIAVVEIAMDRSFYANSIASTRNFVIMLSLVAIVIALLVAYSLTQSIVRPLRTTVTNLRDIAEGEGDLTRRLDEHGKDELSELAQVYNQFVSKVQDLIRQVSDATNQMAASTEELSHIASEGRQGAQAQHDQTTQVATAMHQMTVSIQEIAANTNNAAATAENTTSTTEHGRQAVSRNVATIDELAREVMAASVTIKELEQQSNDIGQVLEVIGDIADQTNLLALNAAIEAARAGDQGRGFAVVADEVRSLAQRTQQSTGEIEKIIESIQSSTRNVVTVMERNRLKTDTAVTEANDTAARLTDIKSSVDAIHNMNTQVAAAVEEQSHVAEDVNRSINTINEIAEQSQLSVGQTAQASAELAELATQLQSLVGRFKI
ncbi:methyl-accepting chemotaxis protein [Oceanisphaera marina]|uniref:Methyl-accepting chemotaxis protein n=1 Tax=Oceanisphaera marina TaxID=2017550 RepID=A0ABQ1ICM7_9GAMM|nr:methyl-accepting chemotaxis protein [Oceanisphaera marina]GGB34996.1 methyl-accepting chemotaxis protein [Oceanisphaera marina]